jgi:ATP-dependent helicase/nuclease subunit A
MTVTSTNLTAIETARVAQASAIDPTTSAWVSASAGSGKTTVLTNRVLSLMLAGVPPPRILCLTFTKAAAAEMANRIRQRLGQWVIADETDLLKDLETLLARAPRPQDVAQARQLFAKVLDAPGGLRIETLHAFCQSLLRRFPLEAGISPQFELIEDRAAAEALDTARERVILAAASQPDSLLAQAINHLTARLHESRFADVVAEINAQRSKIERLFDRHGGLSATGLEGVVAEVCRTLAVQNGLTEDTVRASACDEQNWPMADLRRAAAALAKGKKGDQERSTTISQWLDPETDRLTFLDTYCEAFVTQNGSPRDDKNLATKDVTKSDPGVLQIMQQEAARLAAFQDELARVRTCDSTRSLLTVALDILSTYRAFKGARSLLDYDDLIQTTRRLLATPGRAAWVLYKLDGGIDHILVDEAQDTNPEQWDIVGALTDEFFSGLGRFEDRSLATTPSRTVFAVGDRKQSIYSFQGADPSGFDRWKHTFASKVAQANGRWNDIKMNVSFRSTTTVLKAVDAVFQKDDTRGGVAAEGEVIAHLPFRNGHAGRVELWPLVSPLDRDAPPPWKPPIERSQGDSPQNRLASLLAERIAQMVGRDPLPSRGRTIEAGDIMVLVRRRTGFVDELVRQLKARRIAVAGVDRMRLPQQLAVMDLLALGDFLLLPSDDLTLATVLKSPLIGLTEERLFDLAYPRGDQSLWSALCAHAGAESDLGRSQKTLADLLDRTDFLSPYRLFSHVVVACEGRKHAISRLGFDADDPIDEFLSLALAYEKTHAPSLQAFLHWVRSGDIEIKRDLDQGGDAVRIMTVHGAKGLQAPIVFLPDTAQTPSLRGTLYWTDHEQPVLLWCATTKNADAVSLGLREDAKLRQLEEYRRLLYVAMTRAEDQLYIAGWGGRNATPEQSWYAAARRGLESIAGTQPSSFLESQRLTKTSDILAIEAEQTAPVRPDAAQSVTLAPFSLPEWATTLPIAERQPPQPLAPSRAIRPDPTVASPVGQNGRQRFQRGLLIHKLLQMLPDIPVTRRQAAAVAFLHGQSSGLAGDTITALINETIAILDAPEFKHVFAPGSMAEVPVVGLVGTHAVSGQVDRLAVTAEDVWIVDYKTNRPPPRDVKDIDWGYVYQMAIYSDIIRRIYPAHIVRCALIWTDGPFIMEVPSVMLDTALASVRHEVAA